MDNAKNEAIVRRDILVAFEYSYAHDDWVTPLDETLDGVTIDEAAWRPKEAERSIWEIVRHLTVWLENGVERRAQRARGEAPGKPIEGAWPELPDVKDESAWKADVERLQTALTGLRTLLETAPLAELLDMGNAKYSQLSDLMCRFTHNAYHIGQITKLREWYAASIQQSSSG